MQVGITIDPRAPTEMKAIARAAEDAGIDLLACGDSQSMYREVYTTLAVTAESTRSVRLAVVATNPKTRHLSVTAGAIATLDEISNGRAILGMAIGDSAVKNTELDQASLSEVKGAVETIKELFREGRAQWRGSPVTLRWPDSGVPVYLTGEGPLVLAIAGEVADGVVNGGWVTETDIEWARSRVALGAERAGRDAGDIEFWTAAPCEIATSARAATDNLRHILAAKAHIVSMRSPEDARIPDHLVSSFRQFGAEYRSGLHNQRDSPYNAELLEEHGLLDYLRENGAIVGDASDVRTQLQTMRRWGVDGVLLAIRTEDPVPTIRRLGSDVLPALAD